MKRPVDPPAALRAKGATASSSETTLATLLAPIERHTRLQLSDFPERSRAALSLALAARLLGSASADLFDGAEAADVARLIAIAAELDGLAEALAAEIWPSRAQRRSPPSEPWDD